MKIQQIDLNVADISHIKAKYTGCVILTQDKQLLLQQRRDTCHRYPGMISSFGGKIESDESPLAGLIRELDEELGAQVLTNEPIFIGAVTEAITQHTEIVYEYFWHDIDGRITGCFEETPLYFDSVDATLKRKDKLMDDVIWALTKCQTRSLI